MFVYLFPVAVVVVDADEGACEGENFAEGDEDGGVNHPRRGNGDARREQCAAEEDKTTRQQQLTSPAPSRGGETGYCGYPLSEGGWGVGVFHQAISPSHWCHTY